LTGVFVVFVALRFTAAAAYLFNRYLPAPSWRLVAAGIQRSYRRDVPTYLAIAVVTGLCVRLDILMVSKLLSLHDAGIYAAASRLSDAALMLPTTAAVVIFPTQARMFETNRAGFANLMSTAIRWYLIAGFAAALLVFTLSPFIVQLLYAPALAAAAPVLEILILGAAMMVLDQLLSTTMMAARAQHADLRSMIFGLVSLVGLILILVHFFGLLGAAMASPAALLMRVLYRLRWAQQMFARPLVWSALRVVAAAAVAVAVLYLGAASGRAVDLIWAYAAYGILLWATGSLQGTDFQALRAFVSAQRHGAGRA
jgi:O-antigen/teichoic acid export membrane protein